MMSTIEDLQSFSSLSRKDRASLMSMLLRRLGRQWEAGPQETDVDALQLNHSPSGLMFSLVPGGRFRMGFTQDDDAALRRLVNDETLRRSVLDHLLNRASPERTVLVHPFLMAVSPLTTAQVVAFSGGKYRFDTFTRDEAQDLATILHFRLPSEAELEWVARDGTQLCFTLDAADCHRHRHAPKSRFGIQDFLLEQWAADDWHENYVGAPTDSGAWLGGEARGVYRGAPMLESIQSRAELLEALAAVRHPGPVAGGFDGEPPDAVLRLAASLPPQS